MVLTQTGKHTLSYPKNVAHRNQDATDNSSAVGTGGERGQEFFRIEIQKLTVYT